MNSNLQNNNFIGFLGPKNVGKGVSFIILSVLLYYKKERNTTQFMVSGAFCLLMRNNETKKLLATDFMRNGAFCLLKRNNKKEKNPTDFMGRSTFCLLRNTSFVAWMVSFSCLDKNCTYFWIIWKVKLSIPFFVLFCFSTPLLLSLL